MVKDERRKGFKFERCFGFGLGAWEAKNGPGDPKAVTNHYQSTRVHQLLLNRKILQNCTLSHTLFNALSHYCSMATSEQYFKHARLSPTTYVIHEVDVYKDHPFIYVKIYDDPPLIVLSDTGSGGGQGDHVLSNLREFIETYPIPTLAGKPMNPRDSEGEPSRKYAIFCTHCHYDHILGLKYFPAAMSTIVASSYDKDFVQKNLDVHSLCKFVGADVPKYKVSYWINDYEWYNYNGQSLGLQVLHTPGHTPDELAFYDKEERHLFVGDSFNERVADDKSYEQAILFPKEGNLVDFMRSLDKLIAFVGEKNSELGQRAVKIGCGHVTSAVDGLEILLAVKEFFVHVIAGNVPIVDSEEKRGEKYDTWKEEGEPRFSVTAPSRLVLEATGRK